MEECDTSNPKVSDSAYSTSCNSRSQRSSGSSKSRHSVSSNSSGYCGHPSTLGSVAEFTQPSTTKRIKEKKKKSRSTSSGPAAVDTSENIQSASPSNNDNPAAVPIENGTVNNQNLVLGPELILGGNSSNVDDESLQIAIISMTLNFVRKLQGNSHEPTLESVVPAKAKTDENRSMDTSSDTPLQEEEFTATISMNDGMVKHTSSGLMDVLGFPYDTWTGRCITDFVQPKHRNAFASHVTSGVTFTPANRDKDNRKTPFYCNIRSCRKNSCNALGVQYQPCQLAVAFRQHLNGFSRTEPASHIEPNIYMVITITPINSAYTYPEETRSSPKFATRLVASSHLSEVDPGCISYLGFLPHEMLGTSVLDFYHPEDMPFLKDVYEAVLKHQGHPFLSKPYRFRTQNGGYVLLETEWSSYSNPWSHRLEFIIALNRVLKGPPNPDVFAPPQNEDIPQISEEVLKESKLIQEEILCMLNETVTRISENSKKRNLSKRCKVLTSYTGSLLEDLKKADVHLGIPDEQYLSERDSVMLGEISPHHDYFDSKSSSETPPSYNQLNYNDNIQRFFESKPKTTRSDESRKEKGDGATGKNSPQQDSSLGSGDSGGGSGPMSGSAGQNSGSATSSSQHSYQPLRLTEALLCRHNEDMEKRMVQLHREQRSKHSDSRDKYQKNQSQQQHGVKRIGSHSWENDSFKGSKHLHVDPDTNHNGASMRQSPQPPPAPPPRINGRSGELVMGTTSLHNPVNVGMPPNPTLSGGHSIFQSTTTNLWQPFSMATVASLGPTAPFAVNHGAFSMGNGAPGQPLYYMGNQEQGGALRPPFLPGGATAFGPHLQLVYHPLAAPSILGASPLIYSPLPILQRAPTAVTTSLFPAPSATPFVSAQAQPPQPQQQQQQQEQQPQLPPQQPPQMSMLQPCRQQPTPASLQQQDLFTNKSDCCRLQCSFQRPPSQATSVKAEPGSARDSVASASRQAMSVLSNKNKYEESPSGVLSPDENKTKDRLNASCDQGEGSSFYPSHYSYVCTDISDESLKSFNENPNQQGCECSSHAASLRSESTRTERDAAADPKKRPMRSGPPPWMEGVDMTPDVILRYQMEPKNLSEVLSADLTSLSTINQPKLVDDQLSQLYSELVLEGRPVSLALDEGISSSGSSCAEEWSSSITSLKTKRQRSSVDYSRLLMIFEDNAPIPSPSLPAAAAT